ncbi:MAG: chloramphenicol-sensitive protein RarD [Thermoleophilaceae bacterium]|nr:chloramphenicol-sensitive protein RarD [Thermoleophilaceae bacterium]
MQQTTQQRDAEQRLGVVYGLAAYLLWGLFPLFFPLLKPAKPVEILAHRIVWSLAAVVVVLAATGSMRSLRAVLRDRRKFKLLSAAAVLIAINWGTFIYAVNSDHVIESSLGYFITPLVSVAFGVFFFRERLRQWQYAALGLGAIAVALLAIDYGRPPYIALILALSFGTYGLLKKLADVGAAESLALETLVLLVPALVYLVALEVSGGGTFAHRGADHVLLLMAIGPVTAVPLLFFAGAVTRVPLTVMGMLQYLAPVLQFLVGLTIVGEAMPATRWIGFGLVWIALVVLSIDGLRASRRTRRAPTVPALEPAG